MIRAGNTDNAVNVACVINVIFDQIKGIYPAWRNAWRDTNDVERSKSAWYRAINESEICSTDDIERGLKRCRQDVSPFVPSTGQFLEWCLGATYSKRYTRDKLCSDDALAEEEAEREDEASAPSKY